MSLLKNLVLDETIADETDRVSAGGVLNSGLYKAKITLAYEMQSKGGAVGLVLHFKTDQGRDIRSTQYLTSGTAKGSKNFYITKAGEKAYLPGFMLANSLALLTLNKDITTLDTETKLINLYDFAVKAEVPTKVEMVMELLDKEIIIGLIKQKVDKNAQNDLGVYVATGETRDENEVDKFFRAEDSLTTSEIKAGATEAVYIHTWAKTNKDLTRDRTSKDVGTPGAPKAAANNKPTQSLFT